MDSENPRNAAWISNEQNIRVFGLEQSCTIATADNFSTFTSVPATDALDKADKRTVRGKHAPC
jgi:hypothetical protein